jgi:hypothetical protein
MKLGGSAGAVVECCMAHLQEQVAARAVRSGVFCGECRLDEETAMSADPSVARQILMEQILDATTISEVHAARQALRDWISAHPEDEGMSDTFEQLSLLEDAAGTAAE